MPYRNNQVTDPDGPLTSADLAAVERDIGQALPQPLRDHYLEYNGGQLVKYRWVARDGQDFELHQFLAMRPTGNGEFEETYKQARTDPGFLPPGLVPFAIDQGGALFCLGDTPGTAGRVFFFNSEDADDPAAALVELAPSLRAFIEGMA